MIDIRRLKQRCDHADDGDDPCDLVLSTGTVRELIALAERADALAAHAERLLERWDELAIADAGTDDNRVAAKSLTDAFCETPETSLAERDRRVAAEALCEAADRLEAEAEETRTYAKSAYYKCAAKHLREIAAGKPGE